MRSLRRIVRSFTFAFDGLRHLFRTQANFWVHCLAALAALAGSLLLGVDGVELAVIVLSIGLVISAEAFNTAIEAVVDLVTPELHPLARIAKDAAAAGVLLSAGAALLVGLIVLLPRLLALSRG